MAGTHIVQHASNVTKERFQKKKKLLRERHFNGEHLYSFYAVNTHCCVCKKGSDELFFFFVLPSFHDQIEFMPSARKACELSAPKYWHLKT